MPTCFVFARSKTRLLAEKINKEERKGLADINLFMQGKETEDFWEILSSECEEFYKPTAVHEHVPSDFIAFAAKLYRVGLGMGYLELPQVRHQHPDPISSFLEDWRAKRFCA